MECNLQESVSRGITPHVGNRVFRLGASNELSAHMVSFSGRKFNWLTECKKWGTLLPKITEPHILHSTTLDENKRSSLYVM